MKRILVILIVSACSSMSTSCSEKNREVEKDPLDSPSDYYEIQGRVYKTRDYFDWEHFETSRDIFYEYHFDKNPPLKGELKQTTLFGLNEGELISVIVSKKDPSENYYNGPGVLLDTILEFDRYD